MQSIRIRPLSAACLLALGLAAGPASAAVTYLGAAEIPGTGHDLSGLSGKLQDGVFDRNTLNGFTSAIAYTGVGNRYLLLPDRGPNAFSYTLPNGDPSSVLDDTQNWENRYQVFDIDVTQSGGVWSVQATNVNTTILERDLDGQPYIGLSSAFDDNGANRRLDPEGIRVGADGSVYVSDEYGPHVYRFDARGNQTATFFVPDYLTIDNPNQKASVENSSVAFDVDPRRVTNRGMEGLALSPDGSKLIGMMQNALQQDGGTGGSDVRILVWDTANPTGTPEEYVYQLNTGAGNGMVVSEIVAVNDHEFLIIERDKDQGDKVQAKNIVKIDLAGATNVAGTADLGTLGNTYTSVGQSLFMDLVGNTTGITDFADFQALLSDQGLFDLYPEKLEGIAFGPDLEDGRHLLLIGNDNDFRDDQFNYVFAFAVDPLDLAYQAQTFSHGESFVPVPAAAWLFGSAVLGLAGVVRRRKA